MNPLSINSVSFGAVVLAAVLGTSAGWAVNGWRLGAEIAGLKADREKDRADQAQAALADLAKAAQLVKLAADGAQSDLSSLSTKLDQIRKDVKNAKPAPLPVDCRPDAPRVRELTGAAAAVDEAVAGHHAGR